MTRGRGGGTQLGRGVADQSGELAVGDDDFPREARDTAYEDRIKQTYPIHPELFDRLYEDWSSLERFQRTRGVLRLMNAVIHALWEGEDQGPLIMPGSIPLGVPAVNSELTQYLQDSWKAIISADCNEVSSWNSVAPWVFALSDRSTPAEPISTTSDGKRATASGSTAREALSRTVPPPASWAAGMP